MERRRPNPENEGPPSLPEIEAKREEIEKFIDASLEELLERHMTKFDEGNNGVVLRLRMQDIPPKLVDSLKEHGIELGDDKVAKILKIYGGGRGKQEFEMQKKAHELVAAQGDRADLATVPKPYFFRDLEIGDAAKDRVSQFTGKKSGDRVEMFLMDYVPGDDLAKILYKELVKRHPKTVDVANQVDELPFAELQDRVFQAIDAAVPGGKSRDVGERDFEMRKIFDANAEKIYTFLERSGFHVDPGVVDQIENTMKLFHENGIAFRDGHQRNFMVTGDIAASPGKPAKVSIIDYGSAISFKGPYTQDLFREVEGQEGEGAVVKSYPEDFAVAKLLRRFTTAPGDRANVEALKYREGLGKSRKALENNARYGSRFRMMLAGAKEGRLNIATDYQTFVGSGIPSEGAVDMFLAAAAAVMSENPEREQEVKNALEELEKKAAVPWLKNKFNRLRRS